MNAEREQARANEEAAVFNSLLAAKANMEAIDRLVVPSGPPVADVVDHPQHYIFGKFEVIDVIEDWGLDFHEANALKYIARAKHKGHELEDLKKARWYLDRRIQKLEG